MSETVFIFGHKNPDTDSICSAIAYAHLKNQLDQGVNYEPIALGKLSHETQFILEKALLEVPEIREKLHSKVYDLELTPIDTLKETDSVKKAFETLTRQAGRSLPVVDAYEHLIGIVSISDIIPYYLNMEGADVLSHSNTPFENLIQAFGLEIIHGNVPEGNIKGAVRLFEDLAEDEQLERDDVLFCDVKTYLKGAAMDTGSGHIVVANVAGEEDLAVAANGANVFATGISLCSIMKVINQTVPVGNMVHKEDLEYFMTYETIDDVKENMVTSKYTHFPVVNEEGFVKGIMSIGQPCGLQKEEGHPCRPQRSEPVHRWHRGTEYPRGDRPPQDCQYQHRIAAVFQSRAGGLHIHHHSQDVPGKERAHSQVDGSHHAECDSFGYTYFQISDLYT